MPLYATLISYGKLAYENFSNIFSHGCGKNGSTVAVRNKRIKLEFLLFDF